MSNVIDKANQASLKVAGHYEVECLDADGNVKWVESFDNTFVNEGLDHILDVVFSDGSQDTTHYVGLKGSGAVAAGDTLASQGSWSEFDSYTGDRKAWTEAGVSSQSITNSASPAAFSISGSGTVAGAFLCNAASGTSGKLYSAADFTASRTVASGDTLNVTYTVDISAS
jgi:hypothetical protein